MSTFIPNDGDFVGSFGTGSSGGGYQTPAVTSVNTKTGDVVLGKADVGLGNVDNTKDVDKNVLTATKFATPRSITFTGGATGTFNFDGSANVSVSITVDLSTCLKTSDSRIAGWNTAATASHTHANKTILDATTASFTTEDKSNLDDAVDAIHTHANKTILDATTAAFTTEDKSKVDSSATNSHTHSNKAVLDATTASFTTTDKSKLDGLVQFSAVKLTQAEYDLLGDTEKNDPNVLYVIVG